MTSDFINPTRINWESIESISEAVLSIVPQQPPFRFIDKIIEINDNYIESQYTYKNNEWFYKGHFPGNPITPGVIQIETMAQSGVVAFGIYLALKESLKNPSFNPTDYLTVFVDVKAEFIKPISPGTKVTIKGNKLLWRRKKISSEVNLFLPNNALAASATLSGIGVRK